MADWLLMAAVIVLVAFVPSILYLVWIRNTERYSREPYGRLLLIFFYGAIVSVIIAIAFELVLTLAFSQNIERVYEYLGENPSIPVIVLACVIAPFVEEAAKGLGIRRARRLMTELENGIIYGAAVGLGFAATENLLYESAALAEGGAQAFIATAVIRSISSALLHATSSSLLGLGIARKVLGKGGWFPYYLGAVAMHSAFNFMASFGVLYEDRFGDVAFMIGLGAALAIVFIGISLMRNKIRVLDGGRRRRG
ncbi:MAG TPA: PrsW family intramembrane metalloprotease [Thermoplasmata archaeon]|nr:PrsW family intramembrane metalloprotease [Thermoplasmata archaeon]